MFQVALVSLKEFFPITHLDGSRLDFKTEDEAWEFIKAHTITNVAVIGEVRRVSNHSRGSKVSH